MRFARSLSILLGLLLAWTQPSAAAPIELMADGNVGAFRIFLVLNNKMALADPAGFTLYAYAKDPMEKATCTDACAQRFLPALASAGERGFDSFSVFVRDDGRHQWAFEGKPLYRFVGDTALGEANGHGVDDAWEIVQVPGHEM